MGLVHGFRIYTVEAFENRKAGKSALPAGPSSGLRERISRIIDELSADGTIFRQPRPAADPLEPPRPATTLSVGMPHLIRADFIHVVVEMGETGSHRRATSQVVPAQDISEMSPEAPHIVALLFPNSEDSRFLVVTETIRSRDPLDRFLSALAARDLRAKKDAVVANNNARRAARDASLPVPSLVTYDRLLFKAAQASDDAYLEEILSGAKSATASFQSVEVSARGRRKKVTRELNISLRDSVGQRIGRDVGRQWFGQQRRGETSLDHGVSDLAVVLQEQDLLDDGEAERYDQAVVRVTSESGQTTKIATDSLRDAFTYPVSTGAPSPSFFYRKVAPRTRAVAEQWSLPLAQITEAEIEGWEQTGSANDH